MYLYHKLSELTTLIKTFVIDRHMMQCNSIKCIKINAEDRENRRGNQKYWQHWAHKRQDEKKKHNTEN